MVNKNEEKSFYQMDFYLGGDCNTDFSELNEVKLRSKKIDNLAKRLNLIKDFRKNVFNINILKFKNGKCNGLIYTSTIEEIENWFKKRGIEL